MNSTRAAYARLLLICVMFAGGQTAALALGAAPVGTWVGLALAAAAYVFTQDAGRPRGGGGRGEIKYWRGRRVDDDEGPRRLN